MVRYRLIYKYLQPLTKKDPMKHFNLLPTLLFISFISISIYGCKDDEEPQKTPATTTDTTKVDIIRYSDNIKTLLDSNCNQPYCHSNGASIGSLASYEDAKAFVAVGRIKGAINHETGFSAMPKNGDKLSEANIARIETWITQDTLN